MSNTEQTLFQLFEKESIPIHKPSDQDKEMAIIVEVIDRPDLDQSIIQKVHPKPKYTSHPSEDAQSQRTIVHRNTPQYSQKNEAYKSTTSYGFGGAQSVVSDTPPPVLKVYKQNSKAHSASKNVNVNFRKEPSIEIISTSPKKNKRGGEELKSTEAGTKQKSSELNDSSLITSGRNEKPPADPKSFGALKMPIKRTVTMQPKKTVTFTEKKRGVPDVKIDGSFYSITDNSATKAYGQNTKLPYVPESQHYDEESSEYALSEVRIGNQLSDLPIYMPQDRVKIGLSTQMNRYD